MGAISIPGAQIGVVGGGQLGRMLAEAAAPLGVTIDTLDPTPHCPLASLARNHHVASFDDRAALERLATSVDVLTYEIELADPDALAAVSELTDTPVHPAPETLRLIQDKHTQNTRLADAGIPVPRFTAVESAADVRAAAEEFGYPVMLKARRGGYDGRGNLPVGGPEEATDAVDALDGPLLVEEFVDFVRELSVIGVVGADGQTSYPAVENIHEEEILRETVAPARTSDQVRETAQAVAEAALDVLEGRGVYGIELFETSDGEVLLNEIAPRPHNSGHWTIEGAVCSQFEQHVRAILGAPLGTSSLRGVAVTGNILGDVERPMRADPMGIRDIFEAGDVSLHWYDKREVRPLRKMGHLTLTGTETNRDDLLARMHTLTDQITF